MAERRATGRALAALAVAALALATLASPGVADDYGGREMIVHVPVHVAPAGQRALVVVLHGGLGNADRIADQQSESALNMDAEADAHGFIVAYLNGTPVTRFSQRMLGWNAGGGCCGQSARNEVDDVGYISGAVADLTRRYGIDPQRVYGMGHSNGAMMTQRMLCETRVFAAGVAVSGPLNLPVETCPQAHGARILAIHGADDHNVPVDGGRGPMGVSGVAFASEAHSQAVFQKSGASYDLRIIPGAPHWLVDLDAALRKTDGRSLQATAVRFFGLD
jgi:polyhydroxybutyrate depolymerase